MSLTGRIKRVLEQVPDPNHERRGLMKRILGMWGRGKVTVLAVVVTLVLVMAPAALAANGKPLILGKAKNVATKVTGLVGKTTGAALKVVNPKGGTALDLRVNAGTAPMKVNSTTKVDSLNADQLDDQDSSAFVQTNTNEFVRNTTYREEDPVSTGTALGDGSRYINESCFAGDRLLSGGPANIDSGTVLLESFPINTSTWRVRINNNSTLDSFSVVVLCANQ